MCVVVSEVNSLSTSEKNKFWKFLGVNFCWVNNPFCPLRCLIILHVLGAQDEFTSQEMENLDAVIDCQVTCSCSSTC